MQTVKVIMELIGWKEANLFLVSKSKHTLKEHEEFGHLQQFHKFLIEVL